MDTNYFHNSIIKSMTNERESVVFFELFVFFVFSSAPYCSLLVCTHIMPKFYAKVVDYIHNELRSAFQLTYLFENYALSLPGLCISKLWMLKIYSNSHRINGSSSDCGSDFVQFLQMYNSIWTQFFILG